MFSDDEDAAEERPPVEQEGEVIQPPRVLQVAQILLNLVIGVGN